MYKFILKQEGKEPKEFHTMGDAIRHACDTEVSHNNRISEVSLGESWISEERNITFDLELYLFNDKNSGYVAAYRVEEVKI